MIISSSNNTEDHDDDHDDYDVNDDVIDDVKIWIYINAVVIHFILQLITTFNVLQLNNQ